MKKISGVYKITNTVTSDFYIGSSCDILRRWTQHRCPSSWKRQLNIIMYKDMKKYGKNQFVLDIVEETDNLLEREQYFIDLLKPTYNANRAFGHDLDRYKSIYKKYRESEKCRKTQKEYNESERGKKVRRDYKMRPCSYKGEILSLYALYRRFRRQGIIKPLQEARKYLIEETSC